MIYSAGDNIGLLTPPKECTTFGMTDKCRFAGQVGRQSGGVALPPYLPPEQY